jgi:cytochrome c biogenesis protein CcmG/thiol:disulfide interchange protein DsbE
MNRTVLLVGAVVVIPLLAFLAIGFRFDPHAIESPLVGQPAPPFALVGLDGERIELAALAGRPVVINFWATWCQPCVVEHPMLLEAARLYEGRVHFLGIVYQDDADLIRRFLAERGAWGPSLLDPGSRVAVEYGVYGAPETFVIDSEGRVVRKITGMLSWDSLIGALEETT